MRSPEYKEVTVHLLSYLCRACKNCLVGTSDDIAVLESRVVSPHSPD